MITRDDLETMTSRDLHDRAIGAAKAEGDLGWLWHRSVRLGSRSL